MDIDADLIHDVPNALHTTISGLDYLIGGLFVVIYASQRFNTPATNRSTTTWARYHIAAKAYWLVGLVLFALLAAYQPFQAGVQYALPFLKLDGASMDLVGKLSPPLLAALLLTVLLPRVPYLADADEWIRCTLQHMAAIPFEARRVSAELRKATFAVPAEMRERISTELLAQGFAKEDLVFEESPAPQFLWTKIAVLMGHLEALQADHRFAAFAAAYPSDLEHLRSQYKLLLPKARKCFRLTRDVAADPDGYASRASDAVREYRDEFGEQARALLSGIYDVLSRGALQCRHSYATRCELFRDLGFEICLSRSPLTLNQYVTLFLLLNTLLVLGFVVAEPNNGRALSAMVLLSLRIAVLYNVAILCALYRPQHVKLARPDERGFPPVAWYLLVGAVAAALALAVNAALKALTSVDLTALNLQAVLQAVAEDVRQKHPWLLLTFATAASLAYLTDSKTGAVLTPMQRRCAEGTGMAVAAIAVTFVVWYWLGQIGGQRADVGPLLFRSALIAFAIGALIPTWCRQAPALTEHTGRDFPLILQPHRP